MSYIELYKKYRPSIWSDLVGQEGVVKDLQNEIKKKQVPTAYLFAGKQHGCGKTSAAWIMAKAVNCENLNEETGDPCNRCATCINIDKNSQLGVHYISMANNGNVEAAKDIIRQAQISQPVKRPVWILDECHRMSKEAAEAWLIPLESPNVKALFIFCSTEPEKILNTVKSRVQQKTFRSIKALDIFKQLEKVAEKEELGLSTEQIKSAALEGAGSLRTAMQNLEVIARDGKLSSSYKNKVLSSLAKKDYAIALSVSAEMGNDGQDYIIATQQLFRDFSDMLLMNAGADPSENVSNPSAYGQFAKTVGTDRLLACIDHLGNSLQVMAGNTVDNRILFEIALIKIIDTIKGSM